MSGHRRTSTGRLRSFFIQAQQPVLGVPRQRDDDLVDRRAAREGQQVVDRAEHREAADEVGHAAAAVVEHADHPLGAVAVAREVLDQALAVLAGADDHEVAGQPAAGLPALDLVLEHAGAR